MKKVGLMFLVSVMVFTLVACGGKSGSSDSVTFKLGHAMSDGTSASKLIHEFCEAVEEKTDGRVKFEDFPNSQLGSETEMLEQIKNGDVDSGAIMCGSMQSIEPKMAIEDLPYMWKDKEHARAAYDGKFGDALGEIISAQGMTKIGFVEWGYREITNNEKPIKEPADVKGMKIRVAQNKLRVDVFEELGALPTMLAFSELYGALQQGVVQAQENPLSNIVSANFNEVQKYLSITDHFYNQAMIIVNTEKWNSISEEDQKIILELVENLSEDVKKANDTEEAEQIQTLKDRGMEVNTDVNKEAFREATKGVYDKWSNVFGEDLMNTYNEVSGW